MDPKVFFLEKVAETVGVSNGTRLLDMGSGESKNFIPLLEKFPNLAYVGVEPSKEVADCARETLKRFPNARVYNQLAYESLPNEAPFDVCVSLSVLEHVKQLETFLKNSVAMTKRGGHIIHRYDLGHALSPSSLKEKIQVFLGNHVPTLLPEHKFVRYLSPDTVRHILENNGAYVERITYHQMPNHKAFLRSFTPQNPQEKQFARDILEWEFSVSPSLTHMSQETREALFPAVALWAVKK